MDGSNALNRSMQSLWSTHRKAKLNLNAAPVPNQPATVVAPLSVDELPDTQPQDKNQNEDPVELGPATTITPNTTASGSSSTDGRPSSKRRLRTSCTTEQSNKRIKAGSSGGPVQTYEPPTTRLSDLGGVEGCVEKMLELVAMPLCHPEIYLHTGVQPPRGVLLHGPPGCGKTLLANAIAGELGVPFINISAPSIVSGMSGESEKTLRDTFEEAKRAAPCLLFIDEIDAITPKRESAQREMERRIVAQFLTCMDDMSWEKNDNKPVIVIGATNRPDSLDAALRRAGRFDHEVSMGVPDEEARQKILRVLCAKLRLEGDFDFAALAKATPGYVGADLSALTGAAGIIAVKRIFQQLKDGSLVLPGIQEAISGDTSMTVDSDPQTPTAEASSNSAPFSSLISQLSSSSIAHFLSAHPSPLTPSQLAPLCITSSDFLQPSSKREGFATVPDVTWADVGALRGIREELQMAIVQPVRRPELFSAVGIVAACGVLLWGPPGCGKTLLAKAVANESRANFISVKGPELLNKYVGESERAVRQVFSRARASSPCVIFFDELDALVPRRDDSLSARVVNTLLTELDGLDARKSVYVIAATNRPDMIDPAMVRPGRLDKLLYVDLPSAEERVEILRTLVRRVPLRDETEQCEGYSGADIAALVREAGVVALRRVLGSLEEVEGTKGESRKATVGPSVSLSQRRKYEALRSKFAGLPVRVREEGRRLEEVV
ncbi:P-loop containing nucleoside triphosphate hydrolase protein [Pisolithus orientalis]|uniref:P-loop containing nucleoside triphosphate hydrolase protein n=1 Tax=Pisolithus orientalis TaxID=936130 RepID=UPI0022253BD1|nr:P-loop containing nucleoside triphosphate hydrolase protein [Pisolithus orientalis]KAI6025730.1 P-loop containing nucleoside triphosphate hydrolase protein [Pisolithus orientalis]